MSKNDKLTQFKEGGLLELASIALPLMLTSLSGTIMLFLDRIILAQYSTESMNAAVVSGIICSTFSYAILGISSISEVFVGQYNGAKKLKKLGEPVWQMIWFSLFTFIFAIPLGLFCGPYFIAHELRDIAMPYYQWLMCFGPNLAIIGALSGFFIGQGKTRLVMLSAIVGNLLNVILDIILVFGIPNIVPSMGIKGAAIATVISQLVGICILFSCFISPTNQKKYNTLNYKLDLKLLTKSFKIGSPNAISHFLEITAWAYLMYLLTEVSKAHITVASIGQSIFILFIFAADGMQKAITTIVANFLGAQKIHLFKNFLKSAIIFQFIFAAILAIPLVIYPEPLIKLFLPDQVDFMDMDTLIQYVEISLFWVLLCLSADNIAWVFAAILTAGGDTKPIMIINTCSAWINIGLVYIFVIKSGGPPSLTWKIGLAYSLTNAICMYLRYRQGIWKEKEIIEHAPLPK